MSEYFLFSRYGYIHASLTLFCDEKEARDL